MAKLTDVTSPKRKVTLVSNPDFVIEVRGLGLVDFGNLMPNHENALAFMFQRGRNIGVDTVGGWIGAVIDIICLASDDDTPEAHEAVGKMILADQAALLRGIWEATGLTEDDLGNAMMAVLRTLQKIKGRVGAEMLTQLSQSDADSTQS